ncbi:hypothetical protein F2P79_017608 [Pimephales promelas]|nr:hypothetical protein F2P79_017608 [Pimephales promelas]
MITPTLITHAGSRLLQSIIIDRRQEPHRELHTPALTLSLRLLPAILMDNDEDDDGNFTKWMSSYWGHGEEHDKERKRSFKRPSRNKTDRRASLPCMSQLKAMQVNHLHADNMVPAPVHLKTREEKEGRSHPRARRVSSDENSHTKVGGPECHITTIPELSECLEKRLHVHNQKVISMVGTGAICGLSSGTEGLSGLPPKKRTGSELVLVRSWFGVGSTCEPLQNLFVFPLTRAPREQRRYVTVYVAIRLS